MKKLLLSSVLMVLAGIPAQARSPLEKADIWTGTMTQVGAPENQNYMMNLTFKGEQIFSDYPELGCGGKLSVVGMTKDGYTVYHEAITYGRLGDGSGANCIDGIMTLHRANGAITLGWFASDRGAPILASAQLTPAAN